jgi:hypothetical protein
MIEQEGLYSWQETKKVPKQESPSKRCASKRCVSEVNKRQKLQVLCENKDIPIEEDDLMK